MIFPTNKRKFNPFCGVGHRFILSAPEESPRDDLEQGLNPFLYINLYRQLLLALFCRPLMMFGSSGVVYLSLVYLASAAVVKDSNDLCSSKDPGVEKCMKGFIQNVIPTLVKGVPKYGIFSIDPLRIDLLDLTQAPGRTLDVRHKFMNVDLVGLKSTEVQAVRLDKNLTTLEIDAVLKEPFQLKGNYVSIGKVLALPVNGAGPFHITLHDMTATLIFKGHHVKRKGKIHVVVDQVRFPLKVSKISMNFENLFKGNAQISQAINDALNDNWDGVLEDVKPSFEAAIGEAFKEITNRAFSKLALSDMIKDT